MAERLNDRYELGEVLGSGGMGQVYRARDLRLGRDVAVKVLRGDRVGDDAARARFMAEARTSGLLNHPGIATVHDVGEDDASPDGDPFIVMQLVDGVPLSDVLRRRGALGVEPVERLLGGVGDALAAAHEAGVVHRDVKPANIVLSTDSRPVLVDFGIALGVSPEPLTETGAVLGTVEYISPEQARGQTATGASDVYSLGLVAYQCLTGTSPFRRETSVAAALAQVSEELPALPASVPEELARLVVAMTAKDPALRPTAAQVRDTVERSTGGATSVIPALTDAPTGPMTVASTGPATVVSPAPLAAAGATSATPVPTQDDEPRRGVTRTRVFAGVAALAVVALLLGMGSGVFGGMLGGDDPTVPDVVGRSVDDATDEVEDAGARVRITEVDAPDADKGVVVTQSPRAGEPLADGDVVTLEVASGFVTVPDDLVGEPVDDATDALEKLGFDVETTQVASTEPEGTVLALDRTGRQEAGATITLSVSSGPASGTSGGEDPAEPREKKPEEPKGEKQKEPKEKKPAKPKDEEPAETVEPSEETAEQADTTAGGKGKGKSGDAGRP
ncbi:protein kinase [Aeromicrobium sp. 50.2.37]|uniref:protein kinase domain-containing protein n=1 Tax=Aeromicrobium sp. 50.2.37 TaxID=2969305 RepID=UPI00214F77BF|nr:protein kinase [Aeromicrobium sp. 50.2.37]MCR4514685.1 protein kinase [Aeromicrobium sp. 50.2.37]